MKKAYLVVMGAVCLVSGSAFASSGVSVVRAGCLPTETYEDEAKCFRSGTQGLQYGNSYWSLIPAMCYETKTYKSEALCFRGAIPQTGDYRVIERHRTCVSYTSSYEQEVACARAVFRSSKHDAASDLVTKPLEASPDQLK